MRLVSAILLALFALTGSGAAGYAHERQHSPLSAAVEASRSVRPDVVDDHDESTCAACVAIAAAHATTPASSDVAVPAHDLVARRRAADHESPFAAAPSRRSGRDPPVG